MLSSWRVEWAEKHIKDVLHRSPGVRIHVLIMEATHTATRACTNCSGYANEILFTYANWPCATYHMANQ